MEELLISVLEEYGYPVMRQGSMPQEESYPEHFFTFWNVTADGGSNYDNDENSIQWEYDVNFYSTDPVKVNRMLPEAKQKLKKAGFEVWGAGHDVGSDEPTHTGRGITVKYMQRREE